MLAGERCLEGASPAAVRALAARVQLRQVPAHVAVVREGAHPGAMLYMVVRGVVEHTTSEPSGAAEVGVQASPLRVTAAAAGEVGRFVPLMVTRVPPSAEP